MKSAIVLVSWMLFSTHLYSAQTGPFSPEAWPTTINSAKQVHYVVTDSGLNPPSDSWLKSELIILNDGDQTTQNYSIGGHTGKKVTASYLNIADKSFNFWNDEEFIDVLVQVYGDDALFDTQGRPRDYALLTGTLPGVKAQTGGQIPLEAKNKRWNWVLFRIPNETRADGTRLVGSVPGNTQGNVQYGGVNGGTIRFQNVPKLIVRAVAFGQQGAFGEPSDINKFLAADAPEPEPNTNLAGIDFNKGITNHIQVLNSGDQSVTFQSNVGPANDMRRAVSPNGQYLNFGITDYYLGKPSNDPHAVKIGVEFYDDPAFAGLDVRFGPENFATDDKGSIDTYPPEKRQVLSGTGQWIRRSWTIPAVNLKGINVGTLTGGPRLISENGQVCVSSFYIAILRTGTHPLAGQDPLSDWYEDPNIITDVYGNYAELDLAKDFKQGLDVGNSGGDQEMILAEAGPDNDRRLAVRPAQNDGSTSARHDYLNFAILDQAFGPSTQPAAHLVICVTYYDDPQLAGKRFKPEVYMTEREGVQGFGFAPDNYYVILEGTGKWREAYWELKDVKFNGVNQGPQAAARFLLNDKIFFARVRYAVIRPAGPNAKNLLESAKPTERPKLLLSLETNNVAAVKWPISFYGFALQSGTNLNQAQWQAVNWGLVTVTNNQNIASITRTNQQFFRLSRPW